MKQAAIASRGNCMVIVFQDGVATLSGIGVKDGLENINNELIFCYGEIIHDNLKKYLKLTYENGDSVFNIATTVNKCIALTTTLPYKIMEIQLKEIIDNNHYDLTFELGEVDDNLAEIYGGAFYNSYVYILYQDNALETFVGGESTASTYSLRGKNTSILDKLRQTV